MYKGMKIEWYPDECARPLPKVQHQPRKESVAAPAKKSNPMVNRFQMLNMDGSEEGSSEDGESDLAETYPPAAPRTAWAAAGIVT